MDRLIYIAENSGNLNGILSLQELLSNSCNDFLRMLENLQEENERLKRENRILCERISCCQVVYR